MKHMDDAWKEQYEKKALKGAPDHELSFWSPEGYEELLDLTPKFIQKIDGIKTILDIGCGPGNYCNELDKLGYVVTGMDYSSKNVDIAKKRYPHIKFIEANAYSIPFGDDEFDCTICIGVLQCVFDYKKILLELTRVSRKAIIISTLFPDKEIKDPHMALKHQLKNDTWPTREYSPSHLTPFLEEKGFKTKVITHHNNKKIVDGYFIIAEKK